MEKEQLVLSFDCGTQSVRALLFNSKGELIAKEKETFTPYFSEHEGYAEQEPELYYTKICEAAKKLKEKYADFWDSIIGISVTSMRDVGICVDKDMNVLRPAILWMDRRKAKIDQKLGFVARALFKVSGMDAIVRKKRVDCKSNWIRQNQPDIWKKTDKFLQLSTYINYKMTGNILDSAASVIGHIPIDYKKRAWYPENHYMSPLFKVEQGKLFPMVEPCEILGYITKETSELSGIKEGLPVIAAGSDKGCETLGTGAIDKETASLSFGTTATVQLTTEKYVEPITFLPAYPAVYPKRYNPEIMVYRGYWTLTWFIEQFVKRENDGVCCEKMLDEKIKDIPPGCNGLFVEPHWGPEIKSPEARGAMIGFNDTHTLVHIYKAIIEGINYELMTGLYQLEKQAKTKIKRLTVSGGGANSDIVCQITADMFGLPVVRAQTFETSGLGAAVCAFTGLKIYPDIDKAIGNMVHISKTFTPNENNRKFYREFYDNVYKKAYNRLKPIFTTIKNQKEKENV